MRDRSENERKAAVRRAVKRARRACDGGGPRPEDKKRWAWSRYIFAKYGLDAEDVARKWEEQDGLCPICKQPLATKRWVIEHRHVVGFRKLPPQIKAQYFRGLVDNWCNHRVLSMAERGGRERAENVAIYLDWATSLGWAPSQ